METRIDRIEKYIEEFAKGMLELKESQKKTDAQIMELKEAQKKTDAQLKKTIKKLDDIGVNLGKMGLVQGEVAEELFYRNVEGLFVLTQTKDGGAALFNRKGFKPKEFA